MSKATVKNRQKFFSVGLLVLTVLASVSGYVITRSHAATTYDATVLADQPVAYWGMGGSSTETDLTGNGHTGTYMGGKSAATLPNGDAATDFNGSSQYMTVPSSAAFSIPTTKQLTWEAWIRPDVLQFPNASSDEYIDWMGKCQDYSPTCEWEARMYSTTTPENRCNRLSAYVFNPSAGLGSAADWQPVCGLIKAGQWLHVVGEYQTQTTTSSACSSSYPGQIDIWVDGIKWDQSSHGDTGCMSQYSIIPKAGSSPLNIGTMAMDAWFAGAVGKVAIYNHLLTQTQITNHFGAMTGAKATGSCGNTCTFTISSPAPTPSPSPTPAAKRGDLNGDGAVNAFDLSILLANWGKASATADINQSGTVDIYDLSILLNAWTG